MKTNSVLPVLSTIAVFATILVAPAVAAISGGALVVGGLVALMARDYARSGRTLGTTATKAHALRLAA